jgi:hypothetical protein
MSDLVVKNTFKVGQKLTGLAAKKAAMAEATGIPIPKSPHEMEHRIGIVFDDSGSMSREQITDCHEGIEEFLRSCAPNSTAVTIYPMNAPKLDLTTNLPALAILVRSISASGGTPLVETATRMIEENPITRAIVFSDGMPRTTSGNIYDALIQAGVVIDTVYIPASNFIEIAAAAFMRKLAADTDGIYLQFERGKSNFRTAFKYLSPGLRYMLADRSFVDKLEGK